MSEAATAAQAGTGPSAPDPLIGRVIADRYRITDLIARGGMGKVYRAEQSPLGRLCAVKVLNPNYNGDADPEFHRRFFREASVTARITHPNCVTIFDYGRTDDDVYFMVMEYLDGLTLHQTLREGGPMPEHRVGRIAQQICRALREAHTLDVIHRDLKPANIFLTRHGDDEDFVKVLDFGLVKHLAERPEEQLTQTGLFMGSPKYMAPEQIQGGYVDARTDVYSLGIMMYEMLAGKVPFERPTSVNILMAHVGEPPPSMREVNPNLVCSPHFEDLVMRCIAKDPAARFATMDDVLQAIKRVHGVSLTGQLAVLNSSGVYRPIQTEPPPPMRGSAPSYPNNPHGAGGSSGSHVPIGIELGEVAELGESSAAAISQLRPRASYAWVAAGVALAAALGGLLGMTAFRMTSSSSSATQATAPTSKTGDNAAAGVAGTTAANASETTSTRPNAANAANAANAEALAQPRTVTLSMTTDPAGASVHEDGRELCASTPCDIAWTGDAADASKTHKLTVAHAGFRTETKSVRVADGPAHVKLARNVAAARPPAPAPAAKTPSDSTPSGFKDLPY